MKKFLLTLVAAVFAFAAQAQTPASIAGAYEGSLLVKLEGMDDTNVDYSKIDLTVSEKEGAVDFTLYNFNFMGIPLGDISISELGISEKDGKVVFEQKDPITVNFSGLIEATVAINAAKSYIDGTATEVYVDVIWTDGGEMAGGNMPIDVYFTGNKMSEALNITGNTDGLIYIQAGAEVNEASKFKTMSVEITPSTTTGFCSYDITFKNLPIGGEKIKEFTIPSVVIGYVNNELIIGSSVPMQPWIESEDYRTVELNSAKCSWANDQLTLDFTLWSDDYEPVIIENFKYTASLSGVVNGIESITAGKPEAKGIYTIAGAYVGTTAEGLPAGLYIIDGVKTLVK